MSSIFTALGQIQEGRIAEAQGKFAKQIAVRNQQALERQGKAEQTAAQVEERRVARKQKIVQAQQRARLGKTGGQIAGATLAFLADTAFQFSLERNFALRRGLVRGRELRERGRIELAKGRFARTLGKQLKKLSFLKAGGSILSSFASPKPGTASTFSTSPLRSRSSLSPSSGFGRSNFSQSAFRTPRPIR